MDDPTRLLADRELEPEEEHRLLETVAATQPRALLGIAQLFGNQRRQLRAELHTAAEQLTTLREPPYFPADVSRVLQDNRLEVVLGGRRQIVRTAPEVDWSAIRPGDEVLLGREQNVALMRGEPGTRAGLVGTVLEASPGCVVVRGQADEEIVVACAPELSAALESGDRVLYHRDSQCVLERLAARVQSPFLLEQPPNVRFEDLGGFGAVVAELKRDIDRHLHHPDVVRRFGLAPMRGIYLVGPPGVGKTALTAALANYIRQSRPGTRFLYVKPGALRGTFYGQTEHNIRELFRVARSAPDFVVLFFDELDTLGARGTSFGHTIDDRVMSAILVELSGLEAGGRILCVGATNRDDLCDDGLLRPGRFGDRRYDIPRPDRAAAGEILAKYLTDALPYAPGTNATACREAALAHLFLPQGIGTIATVTLVSGDRIPVVPRHVMSGALIASAVQRAKHVAAARPREPHDGIALEDVLDAFDDAVLAEAQKLHAPHAARRILNVPGAQEIIRVDLPTRPPARHRYLRAVAV